MIIPDLQTSSRDERIAFVKEQWACLNHCPSCGKCYILKGRDVMELYAEYIDGTRDYMEITKEVSAPKIIREDKLNSMFAKEK